jgi:hypothetical protein
MKEGLGEHEETKVVVCGGYLLNLYVKVVQQQDQGFDL